jgi:hypothetical protein
VRFLADMCEVVSTLEVEPETVTGRRPCGIS